MSMGPLGIAGSAAGSPLAQTKGSDVDRARQDAAGQQRKIDTDRKAEDAAGIAAADEDQGASERDADGRRLWEQAPEAADDESDADGNPTSAGRKSKDPTGESGTKIDLTG